MKMQKIYLSIGLAVVLGFTLLASGTSNAGEKGQIVEFNAAETPPSPLRLRMAEKQGKTAEPFPTVKLTGYLYDSMSNKSGVILMPGCLGLEEFHHDWARRLNDWGYTALIVDSAGSRGMADKNNCTGKNQQGFHKAALADRVFDVYGAHQFLTTSAGIDPDRIAVMGWGHSRVLSAAFEVGSQQLFDARFAGIIAYYPYCHWAFAGQFISPTLVLIGEKDDWNPARSCQKMEQATRGGSFPVNVETFADAQHGFDNPAIKEPEYRPDVWNLSKEPARGATLAYDAAASKASQELVKTFLDQRL